PARPEQALDPVARQRRSKRQPTVVEHPRTATMQDHGVVWSLPVLELPPDGWCCRYCWGSVSVPPVLVAFVVVFDAVDEPPPELGGALVALPPLVVGAVVAAVFALAFERARCCGTRRSGT